MNVVPTPATRAIAVQAIAHAMAAENGADAAIKWIPQLHPDQVPAFIGIILQRAAGAEPLPVKPLPSVGRVTRCRSCGIGFKADPNPTRATRRRAGRGLCRPCYDKHRITGTLEQFPRVISAPQRLEAS